MGLTVTSAATLPLLGVAAAGTIAAAGVYAGGHTAVALTHGVQKGVIKPAVKAVNALRGKKKTAAGDDPSSAFGSDKKTGQ